MTRIGADTVFNVIALVAPIFIAVGGAAAYIRAQRALERRAWRAALARQPFHPTQLSLVKRTETNAAGKTPGLWYLEQSVDFALGRSVCLPSRLDYMREFHPEKLARRRPRKAP